MHDALDKKLLGSRIRTVRQGQNMSQADLAARASVSLPLISNIELGKTNMQLETFVKIAEVLQVSTDYLLRADVPAVNALYQGEFSELIQDCSPREAETILKIVRDLKTTMRQYKED
mgnify:CR=1 FL=1